MQAAMTAKSPENKPFQAVSGQDVHIGDVSKTTISCSIPLFLHMQSLFTNRKDRHILRLPVILTVALQAVRPMLPSLAVPALKVYI